MLSAIGESFETAPPGGEPTETETKETLDAFAQTLFRISEEPAELLHEAPHTTSISRPDEVRAARQSVVAWRAAK